MQYYAGKSKAPGHMPEHSAMLTWQNVRGFARIGAGVHMQTEAGKKARLPAHQIKRLSAILAEGQHVQMLAGMPHRLCAPGRSK